MPSIAKKGKISNMNSNGKPVMFICTHKPFRVPPYIEKSPELYRIITNCDDPFPPTKLDILRVSKMKCDYTMDQKSCMNEWMMMNAIYHMKNKPKWIGIVHYRRYMEPSVIERINMNVMKDSGYEMVIGQPVIYKDVLHELHDSRSFYGYWHNIFDYEKAEKVVKDIYPSMSDAFDEMSEADRLYNSQICILERDDYDDLMEYSTGVFEGLFNEFGFSDDKGALEYVRKDIDRYVKPYNRYYDDVMQSRIIGYLAERVIYNTWLREKRYEDGTSILDHAAHVKWFYPNEKDIEI